MKKLLGLLTLIISLSLFTNVKLYSQAEKIIGKWKTIDDNTKEETSYIKIFKATNGLYYGKVLKLIGEPQDTKCTECTGNKKDKPVVGMIIISKMEIAGSKLTGGKIMDPENGKYYSCKMWLDEENENLLHVKGSILWGAVGRTQTWHRL